jgi:hypothetical protein
MASYKNLQDVPVGGVFTIQEKSKVSEYIALQHGRLTINGVPHTLVVRRYVAEKCRWAGLWQRDSYEGSELDDKCKGFVSSFMTNTTGYNITPRIPSVPITIKDNGGSSGRTISRQCFSLSRSEVGIIGGNNIYAEGDPVPYFSSDSRRVARWLDNNSAQVWWLRSNHLDGLVKKGYQVGTGGGSDDAIETESYWYRPAFYLPGNLALKTDTGGVTDRAMPSQSPLIGGIVTVNGGSAIQSGQSYTVSWPAAADTDTAASSITYIVRRSFDNGVTWTTRAELLNATSFTDSVEPYQTSSVKYEVYAKDAYCRSINEVTSSNVSVVSNTAPTVPPFITVSTLPLEKGGPVNVTWGAATDQDNNLSGYRLEHLINNGWNTSWEPVYEGSALSFAETSGTDWNTIAYRVCAVDTYGAVSGYHTSSTYSLRDPVHITVTVGSSCDISEGEVYTTDGDKNITFTVVNTVDPNMANPYTALLTLDGALLSAVTGVIPVGAYTFAMSKSRWQNIRNGNHTIILTVSDADGNSGASSIAFTKDVSKAIIQTDPIPVEITDGSVLSMFILNVAGNFPPGSTLSVWITNNALDDAPVWQPVTLEQINTGNYAMINNQTVATENAFAVRVEADRGSAVNSCYIEQISGQAGKSYIFTLGENNAALRDDVDNLKDQMAGKQEWIPAVQTYADLPTTVSSGDTNYLCRVIADSDTSKIGVWQAIKNGTTTPTWTYFSDNADFVDELELAAALEPYATQQQLTAGLDTKQDKSPYTSLQVIRNALSIPGDTFHGRAVFVSGEAWARNDQRATTHWENVNGSGGWVLYWRENPAPIPAAPFSVTFNILNRTTAYPHQTTSYIGMSCDTISNSGLAAEIGYGVAFSDPDVYCIKLIRASSGILSGMPLYVFSSPVTVTGDGDPYSLDDWKLYAKSDGTIIGQKKIVPGTIVNTYIGEPYDGAGLGDYLCWFSGATQEIIEAFLSDFPSRVMLHQGLACYDEKAGWLQEGTT